jgi:phenylalanyl-tRNA synthetase beta chain
VRERLVALGYHEIVTIPHVDPEHDAVFRAEGVAPARLSNPLAEDASLLRSTGVVTMAAALEWNLNHGQRNVWLFEIGKTYRVIGAEPVETRVLTIGATGLAREKGAFETSREYTFADLKGALDQIGELAGGFAWGSCGAPWLHPARSARIQFARSESSASASLGVAGQLGRRAAERFKLRQDVYIAEILLEPVYAAFKSARARRTYQPLSRFPAVERDFSLVVADGTPFGQVVETIQALGIAELTNIAAVDLFRGGQIPAGKYSLLVRVTFQSREATLAESQLADFTSRIVRALESKLGAALRTT